MTNALIAEIRTGFLVSETARSGAAANKTPSAKFVSKLAPHMRLKAGPRDFMCASLVLGTTELSSSLSDLHAQWHGGCRP